MTVPVGICFSWKGNRGFEGTSKESKSWFLTWGFGYILLEQRSVGFIKFSKRFFYF
jgi:hypothetical protein